MSFGLILDVLTDVRNKKLNHISRNASDCCQLLNRFFRYSDVSLFFQHSGCTLIKILLHFSFCLCYSGSWGAFMSVKYVGSTGIENRVSQSILL